MFNLDDIVLSIIEPLTNNNEETLPIKVNLCLKPLDHLIKDVVQESSIKLLAHSLHLFC